MNKTVITIALRPEVWKPRLDLGLFWNVNNLRLMQLSLSTCSHSFKFNHHTFIKFKFLKDLKILQGVIKIIIKLWTLFFVPRNYHQLLYLRIRIYIELYKSFGYLLSERSVLFPTNIMITSFPLSVLTSSIHLDVCWKEL